MDLKVTELPSKDMHGLDWAYGRDGDMIDIAVRSDLSLRRQHIACLRALSDGEYAELTREDDLVLLLSDRRRRSIFVPAPRIAI